MKKQKSNTIKHKSNSTLVFLERYHSLLFFILLSASLFVAIAMLLQIVNTSTPDSSITENTERVDTSFDENTIERLRKLSDGDAQSPPTSGRTNPFVE